MTVECPYTLQWDVPFPQKVAVPMEGSGPPSNTWFPGPSMESSAQTVIGAAVFAWLTSVTDRQTDKPTHRTSCYSVGNNKPIRSTAMLPNNNKNTYANTNANINHCIYNHAIFDSTEITSCL